VDALGGVYRRDSINDVIELDRYNGVILTIMTTGGRAATVLFYFVTVNGLTRHLVYTVLSPCNPIHGNDEPALVHGIVIFRLFAHKSRSSMVQQRQMVQLGIAASQQSGMVDRRRQLGLKHALEV
jgi:hypothetical protein